MTTKTIQPGQSIQRAVDEAPEGALITLAEGQWHEQLHIRKHLTLRGAGAGKSIIMAPVADPPIRVRPRKGVQPPNVRVENLTLTSAWWWSRGGVVAEGGAQATITECVVSGSGRYRPLLRSAMSALFRAAIAVPVFMAVLGLLDGALELPRLYEGLGFGAVFFVLLWLWERGEELWKERRSRPRA